jgi:hypothetical protein
MAHWQVTVDATNQFLAAREMPARLRMADHYPYHVTSARLDGVDLRRRLGLAVKGLLFEGEPNPLRRARDALRTALDLPSVERRASVSEAAK